MCILRTKLVFKYKIFFCVLMKPSHRLYVFLSFSEKLAATTITHKVMILLICRSIIIILKLNNGENGFQSLCKMNSIFPLNLKQ